MLILRFNINPNVMLIINLNFLKKYDVALSFAEENRATVELVAQQLKDQGIKIFYDGDKRIETWGKELKSYLDKVYRLQAKYCVVFVSADYERKRWTQFEIGRAQARSFFQNNKAYVLPYLLDDSEYRNQFLDVGCLTYRTHDEHKLAKAIKEKLDGQPDRRLIIWFKDLYRIKKRLAIVIVLLTVSCFFLLKDHLTSINTLARNIYYNSRRKVGGAICKDGWFSRSHGSGTCSKHGGIKHYTDTIIYDKTKAQSEKEAEEISWLPP
jgi:hypothetical protein